MSRTTILLLIAAAGGLSLVLSLVLTTVARRIAIRVGFVDHPGGHKSHRDPTPYAGGVAIFMSAWLPAIAALVAAHLVSDEWVLRQFGETAWAYVGGVRAQTTPASVILVGGVILHLLGLLDDLRPLSAYVKLPLILSVAFAVATFGGVRLAEFAGDLPAITLTTLWILVIVNAMNFLDNMDGLSAGVAWICLAFLAVCGLMAEQVFVPALAAVFLGAVVGFWVFNFPPAKIFMGDAGSLVVGYMLAIVAILTTYYDSGSPRPPYALAMPLVILAVPLYDFASVITIRIAEGRSPLRGDQRHFSHRLVDRGLSRPFAVMTIYLATATTGLCATLLPDADLGRTIVIVAIVLMVLAIIAILESPLRKEP